jgi:LysR family glycine cleavage system transcriptional activator
MSRLPSLTALRAYEAAARSGSVTVAARQLRVTPGAVSHQIKLLEQDLGLTLLERSGRRVVPTEAGRAGLAQLTLGFEQIQGGVEAIRRAANPSALVVSVAPSFASAWLLPRLDRYWARHPEIDVRIETKWGLTDFVGDQIDLAIRFGAGGYHGLFERQLLDEEYFPVCAPRLSPLLTTPADLGDHMLIHIDSDGWPDYPTWRMWLKAAGVEDSVDFRRGPHFQISELALKAARDGRGIALGSTALVSDDLREGRLVRPFPLSVVAPLGYYVVAPKRNLERPVVQGFVDWILEEAASFQAREGSRLRRA